MLERDAAPADLVSANMVLANGGNLTTVITAVANSAEAHSPPSPT